MSELNSGCPSCNTGFTDCVCIEAERIYDSCCDKECIEDLCVTLDGPECTVDERFKIIKTKSVEVEDVCINVEPTPFNCGFYAIDITYTFRFCFELYEAPCVSPTTICGTSVYSKKAILYGGVGGNSKLFCSEGCGSATPAGTDASAPKACIQITEPIVLDAKLVSAKCSSGCGGCYCEIVPPEPEIPCCCSVPGGKQCINVTIGLFSIIKLTRCVAISIPIYDFCFPKKSCVTTSGESACEVFDKIDFPTNDFFPKALDCGGGSTCCE